MPLQLDDLAALDEPAPDASGRPMLSLLDGIDEDPDQPRHEFDANGLLNWPRRSVTVACDSRSRCAQTPGNPAGGCSISAPADCARPS